jgi:hypothetical protein
MKDLSPKFGNRSYSGLLLFFSNKIYTIYFTALQIPIRLYCDSSSSNSIAITFNKNHNAQITEFGISL